MPDSPTLQTHVEANFKSLREGPVSGFTVYLDAYTLRTRWLARLRVMRYAWAMLRTSFYLAWLDLNQIKQLKYLCTVQVMSLQLSNSIREEMVLLIDQTHARLFVMHE